MAGQEYPPLGAVESPQAPQMEPARPPTLTFRARLLFIAMMIIGVGGLIWGGWRVIYSMKAPFLPKADVNNANADLNQLIALQNQDTDEDGLSDYDELYVHKTSIYLKDTDSDGYDDKTEIQTGNNPICPAGTDCGLPETNANTNAAVEPAGPDMTSVNQVLSGDLTAEQIRQLLIDSGVPAADLAQIDDASLIQLYQQALTEQANGDNNTNSVDEMAALKNLSADEIRQLLLKQGYTQAELDKIDDDALLEMWQEILAEEEVSSTNSAD